MPTEDRRIIFDYGEIYKAIYALSAQKQLKQLPPGEITEVWEDENDSTLIHITLENPQEQETRKFEYSRDFLAAGLMLLCRGLGIPLPKNAKKSVLIREGQVMLRVQI